MTKKIFNSILFFISLFLFTACGNNDSIENIPNNSYTRNENKIYYGKYPQTNITDEKLISELNNIAGTLPSPNSKNKWTNYNYYLEGNVTSYMYYQDIDFNNDGTYDYRGIYLTSYRTSSSTDSSKPNSIQERNGYLTDTVYWFSYDEIEWDVLTESDGQALIISNLLLDSQDYYPNRLEQKFKHNGGTGYTSNYELSNIRKWLNDDFYNTAFNDLEKKFIYVSTIDNSKQSSYLDDDEYVCNNTKDKMFLLSYQEATKYYENDDMRLVKGTDYAKSQGLLTVTKAIHYKYFGCSCWWLRSASSQSKLFTVISDGKIYSIDACITYYGVRPACNIKL